MNDVGEIVRCDSCGGSCGGYWIPYEGVCASVQKITSEGLCKFCRRHPEAGVTAHLYDEAHRRAVAQRQHTTPST